eukprot:CAMPEP_0119336064 /NCGR_PEP_ID=MMETSP1333-20130426/91033_1 /TAXON_ID=418940 /ORGANISM="Scyphosphaera apsteinii, Strain RCC1455" /LENGTH=54 /DNA_ID=CAMNT_0007346781 /DNA_START=188 /DNA_END=349 /DNA_ORIENTATION=-
MLETTSGTGTATLGDDISAARPGAKKRLLSLAVKLQSLPPSATTSCVALLMEDE